MSQPCAICKGPTVKREIRRGYVSNYCPRCDVYTADSDGKELERWRHWIVAIAWPIACRLARQEEAERKAVNQ